MKTQPDSQPLMTPPVRSSALLGHSGTLNWGGVVVEYECTHITDKAEIERRSGLDAYRGHRLEAVGAEPESAFLNALPPEDRIRCLSREGHPGIPWPIVFQALHAAHFQVVSDTQRVVDRVRAPSISIWLRLVSYIRRLLWPNSVSQPQD